MTHRYVGWILAGGVLAAPVSGCYSSWPLDPYWEDALVDTGVADLPPDVHLDAPVDTGYDGPPDSWYDPLPDTWYDTPIDTAPEWYDVPPDTFSDPPWDSWYDTYTDVGYDWHDPPWDVPMEPDLPPVGRLGDACTGDWACSGMTSPDAYCATDLMGFLSFPGGYCTARCGSSGSCGPSGSCVDVWFDQLCLRTCSYSEECRLDEGYDCMELPFFGGGPYCLPRGG